MKKRVKKINVFKLIAIGICAALSALCLFCTPDTQTSVSASVDDNYFFNRIYVDIDVRIDKTFLVTETLETQFIKSGVNTGIIRDIQRVSRTTRIKDGKKKKGKRYIAGLSDVSATLDGGDVKLTRGYYQGKDFHSIKMQTPSGYISAGAHTFVLSYVYDMSDDKARGYDDFTFDVLGYAMAGVNEFRAFITFPEGTDLSDVTFRTNDKARWQPDEAAGERAEVFENTVSITAFPRVGGKGYTVQAILPDGYFDASVTFYWHYVLFAVISLLAIVACVVLLLVSRLSRKPRLEVIEYLPPDDLDIMQASAVWHKGARYKDTSALILKWAGEGYITIEEDGKRDFVIKPTDIFKDKKQRRNILYAMPFSERNYFEYLFMFGDNGKSFSTRKFKSRSRFFKKPIYECCEKLVEHGDKKKPVKKISKILDVIVVYLGMIPSVMVLLYFSVLYNNFASLIFIMFWVAGLFAGILGIKTKTILIFIFPLIFYGLLYGVMIYLEALWAYDYIGLMYIAPIWQALCFLAAPPFIRGIRTKACYKDYCKLYGFKQFLLKAELPKIQLLFDENPEFFSDILPYCFVLGISEKVQKRFASLNCTVPPYFERGLNLRKFSSSMPHYGTNDRFTFFGHGSGGGGGGSSGGGGGGSSGGGGGGGGSRGC